jgi:hypothetical protein
MLKIYLSSVIAWMIIIYCVSAILESKLRDNGWIGIDKIQKTKMSKLKSLFILSAVPILRLLVVGGVVCMATITKEEYEKVKADLHEEE